MTGELAPLDALGQAELLGRGEVSALELVDAAIERIERLDPQLNAVILPAFERARGEARALGAERPSADIAATHSRTIAGRVGVHHCPAR